MCSNITVLDGSQRQTLAFMRSLGRRGIKVSVGSDSNPCLASSSKYCGHSFAYPSPYKGSNDFLIAILNHFRNSPEAILFPITDVTLAEVLKNETLLSDKGIKIPFAHYKKYDYASSKDALLKLAQRLGIPIPRTIFSAGGEEIGALTENAAKIIGFPLVLKPSRSRIYSANGWIDTKVQYAHDAKEFIQLLKEGILALRPFLIQERIEGPGVGIFLLMKDGEVLAQFAHRRIREKPPSGGVSVLCESISPPPEALDSAVRLLRDLNWYGVAMVEFKWDKRENSLKLMEVNARFWGSLQLAISSGVDFPYLLYRLAAGDRITPVSVYKIGCKMRWELGDLDHLLIRLFRESKSLSLPRDAPTTMQVFSDFILDFIRPSIKNEIFRLDDPKPFLFELRKYIGAFFS